MIRLSELGALWLDDIKFALRCGVFLAASLFLNYSTDPLWCFPDRDLFGVKHIPFIQTILVIVFIVTSYSCVHNMNVKFTLTLSIKEIFCNVIPLKIYEINYLTFISEFI